MTKARTVSIHAICHRCEHNRASHADSAIGRGCFCKVEDCTCQSFYPREWVSPFTEPRFDQHGNRVNPDGSLWNLDGKLAARNGNE